MTLVFRWFSIVVGLAIAVAQADSPAGKPLPDTTELVQKVVDRARWAREQNFQRCYSYLRNTLTQELDDKGNVKSKTVKVVRVTPPRDAVRSNESKPPAEPEKLLRELNREARPGPRKNLLEIDEELLQRYDYAVTGREIVRGRSAIVVTFSPKQNLPVKQFQDRVINKATGTFWIDESEYEVVRADITLSEPVNFVGGLAGTVQAFRYVFERTRVDNGVWLLAQSEMLIKARQLLTPIHTRKQQQWSEFRRVAAEG